MVWQIKPFSHRCHLSGAVFEDGDLYASVLLVDGTGELQRFDFLAGKEEEFTVEGEILCRWRQTYRKEPEKDDALRRQRETAEGLFLSLFEQAAVGAGEGGESVGEVDADEDADEDADADADARGGEDEMRETSGHASYLLPGEAETIVLKKFLGLLLERKKILRPRGLSPDGAFRVLEHARSKAVFPVPAGEITPDEFMSISDRLSELIK